MIIDNFKVKTMRKSFVSNFNIHKSEGLMILKTYIMQREIGKASLHMSINALLHDGGRDLAIFPWQRDQNLHHPFILVSKTVALYLNEWKIPCSFYSVDYLSTLRMITKMQDVFFFTCLFRFDCYYNLNNWREGMVEEFLHE